MTTSYMEVTEVSGKSVSGEQIKRLHHRYMWALPYCENKDIVELACGTGPGLALLSDVANTLHAGDIDKQILHIAQSHYSGRINLLNFDAIDMPFETSSKDVIILFEAIYYLNNLDKFISECSRVLKSGGMVLIATANKDLSDFNPSPYTHRYLGTVELNNFFTNYNFNCDLFGYLSVDEVGFVQKLLRPLKKFVVKYGLMPKTMSYKKFLKRVVFGPLLKMPNELTGNECRYTQPTPIEKSVPDYSHKVIYAVAKML